MKPGWKSTEFWAAIIVAVGGVATTIADHTGWGWLGIVAASLASLGYSLSRGIVKATTSGDG